MPAAPLAWLRRDRTARRVGAWLAVFALLLQMALPLAHDPLGLAMVAPGLSSPICHAGATAAEGAPGQRPASHDPACGICPLCITLQSGGVFLAPSAGAGILAAFLPAAKPTPVAAASGAVRSLRVASQPRAPPA